MFFYKHKKFDEAGFIKLSVSSYFIGFTKLFTNYFSVICQISYSSKSSFSPLK